MKEEELLRIIEEYLNSKQEEIEKRHRLLDVVSPDDFNKKVEGEMGTRLVVLSARIAKLMQDKNREIHKTKPFGIQAFAQDAQIYNFLQINYPWDEETYHCFKTKMERLNDK